MAYTGLIKFSNHAATTLLSGITDSGVSLVVASGGGALFPTPAGSEYFYVTIEDASDATSYEVVKVTARSTDTFTITRAQDGTSAAAWAAGDKVQLRLPRKAITDLETQLSDYTDTVSAAAVSDAVYGAGWDGVTTIAPSKNAVYDKIETLVAGTVSDAVYGAGWNGETAVAPSKNAVYDKIETIVAGSVSDTAYAGSWNAVVDVAPSKNAVYDEMELRATKASPTFTGTVTTDVLTVGGAASLNGGTTIGDAAGDALTINSSAVTCANGINFDSNTLVIDATNNRIGVATASPDSPLQVTGVAKATSFTLLSGGGGQITFQDGTTMNSAGLGSASALSATGNADITGDSDNNGVGNINFISGATTVATITPDNETTWNYGVYGKGAGLGHHVDAYGASTAETAANNKTAIDLAVAAAIAGTNGSNTVIFGPGTYSTDAIVIPMTTTTAKGINIVGAGSKGAQATVINVTAAATGFHFSSDAATDDATTYGSFTLRDISFTGGAISIQIGTAAKAYHPRSKFILDNVFCETYTSNGIKIINTLEGQMQNVVVRGVEGHTAGDAALYITADTAGLSCGDISFYNCEFSGYDGGAVVADYAMYVTTGAVASTVAGLKFTDTHFYHGGTAAAYFAGSAGMIQDVSFLGCQFDYTGATTTSNVGIWLDNTDATTAEDATMWKDFRIIGNYFQTYGKALYIQPGTAGETNVIAKQITFSDNYVANCDVYAVSLQQTEGVTLNNNTFRHCGNSGSTSYAILMAGYNKGFTISGNTHVANRTGAAGSQVPQNSNIDAIVHLASGANYFSVTNNVAQIKAASSNVISDSAGSVEKSIYGNIGFTYNAGYAGTTAYNYFDGTIEAGGLIIANGGFSGSGASLTSVNAATLDGIDSTGFALASHTHAASDINSGTLDNARVNWASPSAIGGTAAAAGTFTTLVASTANSGLKVGTTTTPAEGHVAVIAAGSWSGMAIGWNKSGGTGETDFFNYSGSANPGGGYRFYNFSNPGSWAATSPTLIFSIDYQGSIATGDPGGGSGNWFLGTYSASVPTATGYVEIKVGSTRYKLLAATF